MNDMHTEYQNSGLSECCVSVIICSIDDTKFERAAENFRALLSGGDFEIIRIDDARSLCEGYTRGMEKARGEILMFSHDDVTVFSPDFRNRVLSHLEHVDVLGFAGTSRLCGAGWTKAGHPYLFGQIAHPRADGRMSLFIYGAPGALVTGIQAVDGLLFIAHREAARQIGFDSATFDGFHLYDIDFSFRAHLAGLTIGVATDIAIFHASPGNFDERWAMYAQRFETKHAAVLDRAQPNGKFSFATQCVDGPTQLLQVVADARREPLHAAPAPQPPSAPTYDLFGKRVRPYYFAVSGSPRRERRVREIHLLCHALNLSGEEAFLLPTDTLPELRTPILTPEVEARHRKQGRLPIVIYADPEIADNRLGAELFAYFRTGPGPTPEAADRCYAAAEEWLPDGAARDQAIAVPSVDTEVFNRADDAHRREGMLVCCDGYPDALEHFADFIAQHALITETSFSSIEQFAARFRTAERLYAFGDTPLALEAALCGCPVVFVAPPGRPTPSGILGEAGGGVAFGDEPEALSQAQDSLGRVTEHYHQVKTAFWSRLRTFVARTQRMPAPSKGEQIYQEDGESLLERWRSAQLAPPRIGTDIYARWRASRPMREIDAHLLAERMMLKWTSKPLFHLLVEVRPGEESLLADTLDSLSRQLYDRWHLTVISRTDPGMRPDGIERLEWIDAAPSQGTADLVAGLVAERKAEWIAFTEPGVRLEPQALVVFADYAALRPEWGFIYSDEDFVSATGELSDPRFKPDFNLDLLRSMHYLGGLCLVRREAWQEVGGLGALEGAQTYDLALRTLDRHGPASIGHIADVLYHTPAAPFRAISPANERLALEAHLARKGLRTRVQEGHGYATHRVIYEWPEQPLVSIVIPTRDKPEYLAGCLDTLFARTRYPAVELVLVDNGSTDPEALDLLSRMSSGESPWPTRVVRCADDFNYAALCNEGARNASGRYLLFLDNDTAILQDDWLDRLMASAQRPEVGMVAPRLCAPGSGKVQSSGLVLGLGGIAAGPYDNVLEADDSGYQGRATVDQNASAVPGACLLVRRAVFDELGGFDQSDFPIEHATLDLCLRLRAGRHWIVWTPYVTVAHYGRVSRAAPIKSPERAAARAIAAQRENDTLLQRWLPQLANDPFYNRQLSLAVANRPELDAPITWDTNFHDRPRLIGFPVTGGSGEYRVIQPFRAMANAGLAQTCVVQALRGQSRNLAVVEMARAAPDVIVMHQAIDPARLNALESYKKHFPDTLRVIGLDDLITLLPPKHPSFRKRLVDAKSRLREALALCDRAVVSTEPLAEICRELLEDVRVMPNCLEWEVWGKVEAIRSPQHRPRVGWIGAQQHYGDLEHIFEVVEALAGEVDWIFMGMCPAPIRRFVKEFHPWAQGFDAYTSKMASLNLDLAIAPLDVNPFNEAKSNLRLLEYGAMRWPVVCTDIYPYRNAPVTRVPNTTGAWSTAIREKLSDRDAARREGDVLRTWVERNFILEKRAADWFSAFSPGKPV